jgi:hypothetical protein
VVAAAAETLGVPLPLALGPPGDATLAGGSGVEGSEAAALEDVSPSAPALGRGDHR